MFLFTHNEGIPHHPFDSNIKRDGTSIKVPYGFETDLVTSPRFI